MATYTELRRDLLLLLGRDSDTDTDLEASLPGILLRGQLRIGRELNLSCFSDARAGVLLAGANTVGRPEGLISGVILQMFNVAGETFTLRWKPLAWLRAAFPNPGELGMPRYAAVRGEDVFEVAPAPEIDTSWLYTYRKVGDLLGPGNETNELSRNHGDILLYAAACEGAVFAQEDRRDALRGSYEEAYTRLKSAIIANEQGMGMPQSEIGIKIAQIPKDEPQ